MIEIVINYFVSLYTDTHDFEEFRMRPIYTFFADEFTPFPGEPFIPDAISEQCVINLISIFDDDTNEAEQIFVVEISVDPELQDQVTITENVSLVHIIDNDGEYY